MSNLANLALDGGDPRLSHEFKDARNPSDSNGFDHDANAMIKPQSRPMHDSTITFEEVRILGFILLHSRLF